MKELKIAKLQQYSGLDLKSCEAALKKYADNFWLALYYVSDAGKNHIDFVKELLKANDPKSIVAALNCLKEMHGGYPFSASKMNVYNDDPAFFEAIGRPSGNEHLYAIHPLPNEILSYSTLLGSENDEIKLNVIEVIQYVDLANYNDSIIKQLNELMNGKNWNLADNAMRIVFDEPLKIDLFFEALAMNLKKTRAANNFTAVRAFWSANAKKYAKIVPDLEKLAKSKNSQIKNMAQEILVRYGEMTKENVNNAEEKAKLVKEKSIVTKVAKIKTAKALFDFADAFNWDDDLLFMTKVIEHPLCEIATAKLVYWRCEPNYYIKFASIDEVKDYHQANFALLQQIEANMSNEKYETGTLKYDPKNDHGFDRTIHDHGETKRKIPLYLF